MARGKIVLALAGGSLILFAAFIVVVFWSDTKQLKEGAVDTLDLNFGGQFSTAKKTPAPDNNVANAVNAESLTAPSLGSDKAPLRVVEFVDFGCPYSKEENSIIRELAVSNPDKIWFQERNFPTVDDSTGQLLHPGAQAAAVAAACAKEQGKYWAMNDALYANQNDAGTFGADDLRRYAIGVGVEAGKYDACVKSGAVAAAISADYQAGLALGVTGTPTFFVNGIKFDGAITVDAWQQILKTVK